MNDHNTFAAFSLGPVPHPTPDAVPPELFRGIYGMPMFVNVPTDDLPGSVEFWTRGLGFFDFFTVPDQITHLRRWAFQDVLLVPGQTSGDTGEPTMTVSFSCVIGQMDEIAAACEELRPGCASDPYRTPWNTLDVEVRTPEGVRVVMTAARPFDPDSTEAGYLREMGIKGPEA